MQKPWGEYVRLGIVHFMAFPEAARGDGPIVQSAALLLRDSFFEFLEVGPVAHPHQRRDLQKLAAASGAGLGLACQPMIFSRQLNINSLEKDPRTAAVAAIKEAVEQSREFGTEAIGLASGPNVPEKSRPMAKAALIESLLEICAAARDLPVHLEVFDFDVDKKRLIGPSAEAADLSRNVRRTAANFGLMLDSSHFPLQHERMQDALSAALDATTHIHAGNCVIKDRNHPLYGDTHPRFGIAGGENGVEQLSEYLAALIRDGYLRKGLRRNVTLEVKPAPGESSEDLVAATKQAWQEAWARLQTRIRLSAA